MEKPIDPKMNYIYEPNGDGLEPMVSTPKFQLTNDKNNIITIYEDKIQIIDYRTGKLLHSINDLINNKDAIDNKDTDDDHLYDKETLNNFVINANRNMLVTVSAQMMIKQWDLNSMQCIHVWKSSHKRVVSSMAIDITDTLLATASSDKSIKVWDLNKRFYTHNLKTVVGLINLLKFHSTPDHIWLISCHDDCNIRIWDLYGRCCISQFESHTSVISNIDFYNDGVTMVSFGKDSLINIWNIETLTNNKIINYTDGTIEYGELISPSVVKQLQLNITKPHVIICNNRGRLEIFQLEPFEKLYEVCVNDSPTCAIQFCQLLDPMECTCIMVTSDLDFLTINLKTKCITNQFAGNLNEVTNITCMPNNKFALATSVENIKIFKNNDNIIKCDQILYGHTETVMNLDCNTDGSILVSASKDNTIRVWEYNHETNQYIFYAVGTSHMHSVNCVTISKLRPYFIVSGSEDTTIKKWLITSIVDKIIAPDWTSHGHNKGVNCATISPNNEIIATGSNDKLIIIWNLKGKQLAQLSGHKRSINSIAFAHKDQILISGSTDSYILVWSMTNYSCLKTLEGHTSSVTSVKFFNNDIQIMSSSSDGILKIWSLDGYKCLNTLDGHDDKIWSFDICNDNTLISTDASGVVVVWNDVTQIRYEEQHHKKIKDIEDEQNLQNLVKAGNFSDAISYAIKLNKSRQVYNLLQNVITPCKTIDDSISTIKNILTTFDIDQINFLTKMANEWNTHSKYFVIAQIIIKSLVEITSLDTLQNVLNFDSLISYSDRHLRRINKENEDSCLYGLLASYRKHGVTKSDDL